MTDVTGVTTPPLGSAVTFTVTATNNGPDDASGVTVWDALPSGLTYVSSGPGGSYDPASGIWTVGALAKGATSALTIVARVARTGMMTTTATISGDQSDPVSGNNTAHASVTGQPLADLAVSDGASPGVVLAGQAVTYTAVLTDSGPSDAGATTLNMSIPAHTTVQKLTAPANWSCAAPTAGPSGTISCTSANVAAGTTVSFPLVLAVDPGTPDGTVLSATTVATGSIPDPDTSNNTASASAAVSALADLAVVVTPPTGPLTAGEPSVFTATVHNGGPSDAVGPTAAIVLPSGTTFQGLTRPTGWTCTPPAIGAMGTISCMASSLAAGATATFTVIVGVDADVADGQSVTVAASASSATTDPDPANNMGTATVAVGAVDDLGVGNSATPAPAVAGTVLTFTAPLSNSGPSDAQDAVFTEDVPAGTAFQRLAAPAGWLCTTPITGASGTVSCTRTTVAAGASGTFALAVTVDAGTPAGALLSATATVSGTTTDANRRNNSATAAASVTQADDLAAMTIAAPNPISAGTSLAITTTARNNGPSDDAPVTLTQTLPVGTTFDGLARPSGWVCLAPALGQGGAVACTAPTFPSAASAQLVITVSVPTATDPGTVLSTGAVITGTVADTNPANNTAAASVTVRAITDLAVTNTVALTPVVAGQAVTYIAVLTNAGPSDAQSVVFGEDIPRWTTFAGLVAPAGWSCAAPPVGGSGTVSCTRSSLTVGATARLALAVTDAPATPAGTRLAATANVSSGTTETNLANNSATAQTTSGVAPATLTPAASPTTISTATPTTSPTMTSTATLPVSPQSTTTATSAPTATLISVPTATFTSTASPTTTVSPSTTPLASPSTTPLASPTQTSTSGPASASTIATPRPTTIATSTPTPMATAAVTSSRFRRSTRAVTPTPVTRDTSTPHPSGARPQSLATATPTSLPTATPALAPTVTLRDVEADPRVIRCHTIARLWATVESSITVRNAFVTFVVNRPDGTAVFHTTIGPLLLTRRQPVRVEAFWPTGGACDIHGSYGVVVGVHSASGATLGRASRLAAMVSAATRVVKRGTGVLSEAVDTATPVIATGTPTPTTSGAAPTATPQPPTPMPGVSPAPAMFVPSQLPQTGGGPGARMQDRFTALDWVLAACLAALAACLAALAGVGSSLLWRRHYVRRRTGHIW